MYVQLRVSSFVYSAVSVNLHVCVCVCVRVCVCVNEVERCVVSISA